MIAASWHPIHVDLKRFRGTPIISDHMSWISELLWVGIPSGVLSGLFVLLLLWLRQEIIDRYGSRAFKAKFQSLQNHASRDRWEIRGRLYNNTSMQVYAFPYLIGPDGQDMDGYGPPVDARTDEKLKGSVPIAPKSWREFRIENLRKENQSVPVRVRVMYSRFTLKKAQYRTYTVEPTDPVTDHP